MVDKAVGAYKTISEVSEKLDLQAHVLRFWEKQFFQLRPMQRSGGRRFYRQEDIDLLQTIKTLLHVDGYTIKGAQNILSGRRPKISADAKAKIKQKPKQAQQNSPNISAKKLSEAAKLLEQANMRIDQIIEQLG